MGLMNEQTINALGNYIKKLYPVELYSLYRGYSKERNEWIFGNLVTERYHPYPINFTGDIAECYNAYITRKDEKCGADWGLAYPIEQIYVEKESVGFYTQYFDDRNVPIFEKDLIVDCVITGNGYVPHFIGKIIFKNGEFMVEYFDTDGNSSNLPLGSFNDFYSRSLSSRRSLICVSYPKNYVLPEEFCKKE